MKNLYDPLVGDPCYRYNKQAKEKFFKNVYLSYLFVQFVFYEGKTFLHKKSQKDRELQNREAAKVYVKQQIFDEIIYEFMHLSRKTLELH